MDNGLIVQVLGEMSNNGGTWQKFSQTFFLAEQPDGYYVLNDIFRFLKEEIEPDHDSDHDEMLKNKFTYQDERIPESGREKKSAPAKPAVVESKGTVKPAPSSNPSSAPLTQATASSQAADKGVPKREPSSAAVKADQSTAPAQSKPINSNVKKESTAPLAWSKIVAEPKSSQSIKPAAPKVTKPAPKKEEDADGFKEVKNQTANQARARPEGNTYWREKEKCTIYLRNITEGMDKTMIAAAFEPFGAVLHVDVPPGKKIAFVTFKSVEIAASTIGKSVTINGEQVLAEERRRSIQRSEKKFGTGEKPANGSNNFNRNQRPAKTGNASTNNSINKQKN